MKKNLPLIVAALFASLPIVAQRLVLLEHFTQASCPPCAALNPALNALLDQNLDKVVAIKYQTSWPGTDPMNAANPTDVATRVTYYGVNGVPNSLVDGNVYDGSPTGVTQTMINNRHNVSPGVIVKVSYAIALSPGGINDTMLVTASVKATTSLPSGRILHVAAIEREISFATAPGSNGEKKFESVMKKMFPSGSGTTLPAMAVGDSLNFKFKMAMKRSNGTPVFYNPAQAAAVAFVQNNTNKEVLGAAYDEPRPWLVLGKPEGSKSVRMKTGQELLFPLTLISKADIDQEVRLVSSAASIPAGWTVKILTDGQELSDSALIPLAANSQKEVQFKLVGENAGLVNKKFKLKIDANSTTIFPLVKSTFEYTALTPSNILFLDFAGTATTRFNQVFTSLNEPALSLNAAETADLDSASINSSSVKKLFFSTGAASVGTLGAYRAGMFINYLNSGGKLLVMGQDIGYDVSQGADAVTELFFTEYLGAEFLSNGTTSTITLNKVPTDTVCAPFFPTSLTLSGTGSYPEHLAVSGLAPNAIGFLEYPNGDLGAIYNKGSNWKAIYLGFRMEAFSTTTAGNNLRNTIFGRMNGWFDNNPSINASIAGPATLCQGSSINLIAAPGKTWLWNTGARTRTISVSAPGEYRVQIADSTGANVSSGFQVTGSSQPVPTITVQPVNQINTSGATATFSTTTSATDATFQWQMNTAGAGFLDISEDSQFSGVNTSSLQVSNLTSNFSGALFRCMIGSGSCVTYTNGVTLTVLTGMKERVILSALAYPNPANHVLMVPVNSDVKTITLSDALGRAIIRKEVSSNINIEEIDLSNVENGIYHLIMEAPGKAAAFQKIIIQ